jgi:hypothetical protein
MTITNKTATTARDTQIIAGITKDLTTTKSLLLAGTSYTPTTLIALIQSRIAAVNAVAAARANWLDAVKTQDALDTQVHEAEMGLKHYVLNVFGKTSPLLADFGFSAPKVTKTTTETKQVAIQKGQATRVARGTASKKAKAKIKGTIPTPAQPASTTAPVTTPTPPAPATPVPPAAPAAPTAPPKS